jgi:DNA polymerase-3 subunit epsilon
MLTDTLIVLDFETTGLSADAGHRVTEVAAIRICGNRIEDRFVSLVNCGKRLDPFIISYTGITQEMVNSAPRPEVVMKKLRQFVGSNVVVAHNSSFDHKFFISECRYVGINAAVEPFICSMRLARRVYPGLSSYGLGQVTAALGLKYSGRAHRAEADARLTADLVLKMAESIRSKFSHLHVDSKLLRRIMSMPTATAMSALGRCT